MIKIKYNIEMIALFSRFNILIKSFQNKKAFINFNFNINTIYIINISFFKFNITIKNSFYNY